MSESGEPLSEREIEILRLVATGRSNKEIAAALSISPNTVKVHLRNIFSKIDVLSRTEATLYAIKNGLAASPEASSPSPETDPASETTAAVADPSPDSAPNGASPRLPRRRFLLWLALVVVAVLASGLALANMLAQRARSQTNPSQASLLTVRWQTSQALPAARASMGAVVYENQVYLVGGSTAAGPSSDLLAYDLNQESWSRLPDKPTAVSGVQAALIGEKIYVPGGEIAGGGLSAVLEVYDPRQNSWSDAHPLPKALSHYALCAFEGNLYLFGGWDGEQYSAEGYRYDPDRDEWQSFALKPGARAASAASVLEGRIILLGGRNARRSLDEVWYYYPSREGEGSSAWEAGPRLPAARDGLAAATLANSVYVAGGESAAGNTGPLPSLVLNNGAGAWQSIGQPGEALGSQVALLAAGNFLHVLGGQTTDGLATEHQVYQALYTVSIPLISIEGESGH
jgi:DNA-binding CsgD family transcriptional regulator/N-acetylneuraminic acid mutarotase